eukprot:gene39366-9329_t
MPFAPLLFCAAAAGGSEWELVGAGHCADANGRLFDRCYTAANHQSPEGVWANHPLDIYECQAACEAGGSCRAINGGWRLETCPQCRAINWYDDRLTHRTTWCELLYDADPGRSQLPCYGCDRAPCNWVHGQKIYNESGAMPRSCEGMGEACERSPWCFPVNTADAVTCAVRYPMIYADVQYAAIAVLVAGIVVVVAMNAYYWFTIYRSGTWTFQYTTMSLAFDLGFVAMMVIDFILDLLTIRSRWLYDHSRGMGWSWICFAILVCCLLPGVTSAAVEAWRRREDGCKDCCNATCKSCALGVLHSVLPLGPARNCIQLIWKHARQGWETHHNAAYRWEMTECGLIHGLSESLPVCIISIYGIAELHESGSLSMPVEDYFILWVSPAISIVMCLNSVIGACIVRAGMSRTPPEEVGHTNSKKEKKEELGAVACCHGGGEQPPEYDDELVRLQELHANADAAQRALRDLGVARTSGGGRGSQTKAGVEMEPMASREEMQVIEGFGQQLPQAEVPMGAPAGAPQTGAPDPDADVTARVTIRSEEGAQLGATLTPTLTVIGVSSGSPAEAAGIMYGHRIRNVAGIPVTSRGEFRAALGSAGTEFDVAVGMGNVQLKKAEPRLPRFLRKSRPDA